MTRTRAVCHLVGDRIARRLAEVKHGRPRALSVLVRGPLGVDRESDFPERPVACLPAVVAGRCLFTPKLMEK